MLQNKLKVYYVEKILTSWYSKYYENIKIYENKGMLILIKIKNYGKKDKTL